MGVRIDLCLAVDAIDEDLRRLVEYLNRAVRSDVKVTALQLQYARHGDVQMLIPSTFGAEIAEAKVRLSDRKERWTRESFLDSLSDEDRERAEHLFSLNDSVEEALGTEEPCWYGRRPNGYIFLAPFRQKYQPFAIWRNSEGELMIWGGWTNFPDIAHHAGYAALAEALGQSHEGSSRSVSAASVDLDSFWDVACDCALAINSTADSTGGHPV